MYPYRDVFEVEGVKAGKIHGFQIIQDADFKNPSF